MFPINFILNSKKSRKVAFEMMRLSVSLFRQGFTHFPCTLVLFGIVLVTSREGTSGNLLNFLSYKILTELSASEFRPV